MRETWRVTVRPKGKHGVNMGIVGITKESDKMKETECQK